MRYAVHMNILQLLAYSNDGPQLCLIYEYMEKGNLADRLHLVTENLPLTATQRLHIAVGAAEGKIVIDIFAFLFLYRILICFFFM